jgi:hypothetical protein
LQKVHFSNLVSTVDPDSLHLISVNGKEMWATGGWTTTIKGENFGRTQIKGYFSVIGCVTVRAGDCWKNRMLVVNVAPSTPAGAATPSPTATPGNQ